MGRESVYIPQHQLDEVSKRFGDRAKLSGVVQLSLGLLLQLAPAGTQKGDAADDAVAVIDRINAMGDQIAALQRADARLRRQS